MTKSNFDENLNNPSVNILPISLDTLYWRVYIYCDDYFKKQTDIPYAYHDITARYFASLWKDCFQNKIGPNKKYIFPLNYNIISDKMLFEINSYVDQEFKMFLYDQKNAEISNKLSNVMKFGTIGIKVKEVILNSKINDLIVPDTFNDNRIFDGERLVV